MKANAKWIVSEGDNRPAGKPDECFYCNTKMGNEHKPDCVIRKRTVVCRVIIDVVRRVPEDWEPEDIEFAANEGSSCANNIIDEIIDTMDRKDKIDRCMCDQTTVDYLREATEEDENLDLVHINGIAVDHNRGKEEV